MESSLFPSLIPGLKPTLPSPKKKAKRKKAATKVRRLYSPYDYIRDHRELMSSQPEVTSLINESDLTQNALSEKKDMSWLKFVECNHLYPNSRDLVYQRELLDNLYNELLTTAPRLNNSLCPQILPPDYSSPVLALDLETQGLDTRIMYDHHGDLINRTKIVGICLSNNDNKGYYLPTLHVEKQDVFNFDEQLYRDFLSRLCENFTLIFHNAQYDKEILAINNVQGIRGFPYFFDTQILSYLKDPNEKGFGLKAQSAKKLNRKMIEISELFAKKGAPVAAKKKEKKDEVFIKFEKLTSHQSFIYGISDACNTMALFNYYVNDPSETNPFKLQPLPIEFDHKITDVLRNIYRTGIPINVPYYMASALDAVQRQELAHKNMMDYIGREVNIASPKELSELLFDEYKIPILPNMEKGKSGSYSTKEGILEELYKKHKDIPILEYVVTYRKLKNQLSKIYLKAIVNTYTDSLLPWSRGLLSFSQTNAVSGRLISSSSSHLDKVVVKESDAGNLSVKYMPGKGDIGMNAQGFSGDYYELKKAKKIKTIPVASTLSHERSSKYTPNIKEQFIKHLVSL